MVYKAPLKWGKTFRRSIGSWGLGSGWHITYLFSILHSSCLGAFVNGKNRSLHSPNSVRSHI